MIPLIEIERAPVTGVGVFGDLYFTDESNIDLLICHTIEREWKGNAPSISCIPDGEYWIEPHNSPTHGDCYIVYNERNNVTKYKNDEGKRWGILIHKENWCHKLKGCIAPVQQFGVTDWSDGYLVGYSSTPAFDKLMSLLNGRKAKLILKPKGCDWS